MLVKKQVRGLYYICSLGKYMDIHAGKVNGGIEIYVSIREI
jgi:hypothetical protein